MLERITLFLKLLRIPRVVFPVMELVMHSWQSLPAVALYAPIAKGAAGFLLC